MESNIPLSLELSILYHLSVGRFNSCRIYDFKISHVLIQRGSSLLYLVQVVILYLDARKGTIYRGFVNRQKSFLASLSSIYVSSFGLSLSLETLLRLSRKEGKKNTSFLGSWEGLTAWDFNEPHIHSWLELELASYVGVV